MDKKTLIPIIAMVSVSIMLILHFVGVKNAWLAVFAGGIAIVIADRVYKNKETPSPESSKEENKTEQKKETNNESNN